MKFKFSFQSVLNYRKILENLAERDFHEANAELAHQRQIRSDMEEEVALARENAFTKQIAGGTAGPALSQIHEFLKGQDLRIERQQIKIQEWEKRVEELREILRQKAIDYKIIDKLRDRKKDDFVTEQKKIEQKKVDDLNMMRFRHRDDE